MSLPKPQKVVSAMTRAFGGSSRALGSKTRGRGARIGCRWKGRTVGEVFWSDLSERPSKREQFGWMGIDSGNGEVSVVAGPCVCHILLYGPAGPSRIPSAHGTTATNFKIKKLCRPPCFVPLPEMISVPRNRLKKYRCYTRIGSKVLVLTISN